MYLSRRSRQFWNEVSRFCSSAEITMATGISYHSGAQSVVACTYRYSRRMWHPGHSKLSDWGRIEYPCPSISSLFTLGETGIIGGSTSKRLYLVAVNCWRHFERTMPMRPEFSLNLMDVCELRPHDCSTTYATECLFVSIIEEPISRLGNWNSMAMELQTSQINSKATKSSAHDPGPSSKVGLRFSSKHIIHVAL